MEEKLFGIIKCDEYFRFGKGYRVVELTDDEQMIDVAYGVDISEYPNWSDSGVFDLFFTCENEAYEKAKEMEEEERDAMEI
jgi:hypothetical protein